MVLCETSNACSFMEETFSDPEDADFQDFTNKEVKKV
jgi:hypothetical protein